MSTPLSLGDPPTDLLDYLGDDDRALELVARIDWSQLPRHVAIIMDGNGRWARHRSLPRIEGHRSAIVAVRESVETSARAGVEALTLYAFSRENWRRPPMEVQALMGLLRRWLAREIDRIDEEDIRFAVIGRLQDLPAAVRGDVEAAMERTRANRGMRLNIALSYGGRTEIVDAARAAVEAVRAGDLALDDLDEERFAGFLQTSGMPDPDLLIRTSGEMRVSNFLLWQIAYAELWVTETLWPDWRRADLLRGILEYQSRERRFGDVGAADREGRS